MVDSDDGFSADNSDSCYNQVVVSDDVNGAASVDRCFVDKSEHILCNHPTSWQRQTPTA